MNLRSKDVLRLALVLIVVLSVSLVYLGDIRHPYLEKQLVFDESSLAKINPSLSLTDTEHGTLTLVTYNIHSGKGTDNVLDLDRTLKTIKDYNPDFIFLQEVRNQWRDFGEPQSSKISAAYPDYLHQFLPTEYQWGRPHFGNAILSKYKLEKLVITPLPCTRGKGYRQMVECTLPWGDKKLTILGAHLDLFEDHEAHIKLFVERFRELPAPKIMMGDLNTRDNHELMISLLKEPGVKDLHRLASVKNGVTEFVHAAGVDWIIGVGVKCVGGGISTKGASDHPLLNTLIKLELVSE